MEESKTASMVPRQVPPVRRPELVQPHDTVDVVSGDPEDLFSVRLALLHGANYNDPAALTESALQEQGASCCQECSLIDAGVLGVG